MEGGTGSGDDDETDGSSSGGSDEATTANSSLRLQHVVLLRELQRPVAPRRGCSVRFDLLQQERYAAIGGSRRGTKRAREFFKRERASPPPPTVAILPQAHASLPLSLQALLFPFPDRRVAGW